MNKRVNSKRVLFGVILVIFLSAVVIGALYVGKYESDNSVVRDVVSRYGYLGVFVISFISGFNLAVPVPAISFLPLFLELEKSVVLVILFITIGMTLADGIAYVIGRTGRQFLHPRAKLLSVLNKMRDRYYWSPLVALGLFAAFIPFPNEVLVAPLGFMRYRLRHMFLPMFAGNLVFNILSSIGVMKLLDLF